MREDRYQDATESAEWHSQWSAHLKLGGTYAATGAVAKAVEECRLAVSLGEAHGLEPAALARSYAALGDALLVARQTSQAVEPYQHAREELAELGVAN